MLLHQATDRLTGFPPALRRHGTGIHKDQICRLVSLCSGQAMLLQHRFERLRLILVDLAAKCSYNISHTNNSDMERYYFLWNAILTMPPLHASVPKLQRQRCG